MSNKSLIAFNTNLELLLKNIQTNFNELSNTISNTYTFPIIGNTHIDVFIKNNNNKYNDISAKNNIIFSKGVVILNSIDFNYIWNNKNLSKHDKDILWKYLQTMVLYSIEYKENIIIKDVLQKYKKDSIIDNDNTRIIVNILDNLSNTSIIKDTNIETTQPQTEGGFKLPDLSNIVGKHLMKLINSIMEDIDIDSINITNPLELIKTLLDSDFNLENDTTGISECVKSIIVQLKKHLLSNDLNRKELFKDIQNVITLFNNITNSQYDLEHVFSSLNSDDFQNKFDTIINSLDFEVLLKYFIDIVSKIKSDSTININEIIELISEKVADGNIGDLMGMLSSVMGNSSNSTDGHSDMSNFDMGTIMGIVGSLMGNSSNSTDANGGTPNIDMGSIMGMVGNIMGNSSNTTDTNGGTPNIDMGNIMSSLNLDGIVKNVMSDMNTDSLHDSDVDVQKIFNSISKHLPSNLAKNVPKDMSSNIINQLTQNMDVEQIKKMAGGKKRINNAKLNQLSRLEKRRERLRRKLNERKQLLREI